MAQADQAQQAERLSGLREQMAQQTLAAFIVPHADEHQGEYLPPHAERLAWLTGFTGSAGLAIVTRSHAALFVDGRYTLQAAVETDSDLYDHCHLTQNPPAKWLATTLKDEAGDAEPKGWVVGFDPWLHTDDGLDKLRAECEPLGIELCAVDGGNPIDHLWEDRPPAPSVPVMRQPVEFSGESADAKRMRVATALRENGLDAAVLTAPESICWLLNLRGGDVPYTPLVLTFAILYADGTVSLFLDPAKKVNGLNEHLGDQVSVLTPEDMAEALAGLADKRVRIDKATCAAWISGRLRVVGAEVDAGVDPCALPKACKNPTELSGMRQAHVRDGVAVCRFLAWLDGEMTGETPLVDELTASDQLETFRREGAYFRDLSFPTIVGSGPNGAVVHYRADESSNRPLGLGELFLVDSGAQYLDGTTDLTRTIALGTPSAEMCRRYTQVLKGHIALSRIRFPQGTTGSQLDVLARQFLWMDGVDFDHGTGHGVGSYLSVHEGPQRISKTPSTVALKPGMVISNEPGYYKAGAFGIRIENLITVTALEPLPQGSERPLLFFETLTLAPYDRRLIDRTLLSSEETAWINAYHRRVVDQVSPFLGPDDAAWLGQACAPLED